MVGGVGDGAGARSVAVVLFTDLVGSTELRSRLGEDAAEGLRRTHDTLVAGAIEANRGRVLKHLGDGVMATFGGASDAVAAAVRIHQVLDRHNRSGPRLEVRIGISAGDVVFEKEDCFGTPVIEAARLCGAARGGQVLLSDVVRLLAGSAGGHQFSAVGELELKGLPAPLPTFEVAWQPLPVAPLPFPSLLTAMGRIFVGREQETNDLLRLWKEAAAGERRVIFLAGEPGVGKTRLAAELARWVHEEGATVLAGRCDEDLGVPYQPFVEALRHFVDNTTPVPLTERLGRYGGELTRLVPELASVVDLPPPLESDPETERYRLFDAVAAWLGDISAQAPVILVLDDLQWAAKPTLLLLRHVLRFPELMRLLVVVTYRDTDVGRGNPLNELLADLRRDGGVQRLSLGGLGRSAVGAFIEAVAGHDVSDEEGEAFVGAVWQETEGNPFFVAEVLRHLTETGGVNRRDGRWVTTAPVKDLGIPEGVRDVVGRRLSRLSEEVNGVLRVASVAGLEFDSAVVSAAGSFDDEALFTAVEQAVTARLLSEVAGPGIRYRFAHALVRATLYDEITAARRVTLHRAVAEAIERVHAAAVDDHLPALAHHWTRASAATADVGKAVDYATRAGDRALAQLAHDEAATYYQQALELLEAVRPMPEDARPVELLICLGEAQRRAGDPSHRETLLEAARLAHNRGDSERLARAALANNRGGLYSVAGELDTDRIAVLESALQTVDGTDQPTRARLMANLAGELAFSPDRDRRVALSDAALAIARQLNDPALLADVLSARYFATLAPGNLSQRLAETAELVDVANRLNDPLIENWAAWYRCRAATEAGDLTEAERQLASLERFTAVLGRPWLHWLLGCAKTGMALLRGRLEDAERLASETLEVGRRAGDPEAPFIFALERFQVTLDQGRPDEVARLLSGLRRAGTPQPLFASLRAVLDCERGRWDDARRSLDREARTRFQGVPLNHTWLMTLTNWATVSARLRDVSAESLYTILAPYAEQLPLFAGTANGAVAMYLGMLSTILRRFEQADSEFLSATAFHARIDAPAWLARSRLEWGRMLLTRQDDGDAERARELLVQAVETARQLGLGNVERRGVELLGQLPDHLA